MTLQMLRAIALMSLVTGGAALAESRGDYANTTGGNKITVPLDHTGDYIVPAPAELSSVAAFKIPYGIGQTTDGKKVLSYQLPDLIAGPKKPVIVLTQTGPEANGFIPFGNKFDSANCRILNDDVTCFVLYPSMNTAGSEDAVRAQFGDSPELDLRLRLAQVFSSDPKGVLHIKNF